MAKFRLKQFGKTVAQVEGDDALSAEAEILSYARKYRDDGAVTVQRLMRALSKPYWKLHMQIEQWPGDDWA